MKRTLLMSVAAFALAAGTTVALSQSSTGGQGAGGNTPSANPDTPTTKQRGAQDRLPAEKQKSTQQQSPSTSGQGGTTKQSQDRTPSTGTRDNKEGTSSQQSQDTKSGTSPNTQQSQSPSSGGTKQGTAERSGGGSNVSLSTEQKTKIRQTVLTSSAPRVTNVNFDIKVGTVVPRTVRVAPLPPTVIEIEPQWRGYMYFVYNDEIIIVEPGSLRIVAVLLV